MSEASVCDKPGCENPGTWYNARGHWCQDHDGGPVEASREISIVRWIDSSLQNGQVDSDDFPQPVLITSVGFVVEDTADRLTLARDDMGHDGDYRGLVSIPRVSIAKEDNLIPLP